MNSPKIEIKKLYYSIGEVSKMTDLKQYVLRYWETEFKQLKPPKNRSGNRTYRQKDIDTIFAIKTLLYNKKFTIDGARKQLITGEVISDNDETPDLKSAPEQSAIGEQEKSILVKMKQELQKILHIISE